MFPRLTVLENLEVGCYISKARKRKDEVLRRIYDLFPILKERKNQFSSTLSGGEQQMLAIGRALMCEPKLILFDEISLGLAPLVIKKHLSNGKADQFGGTDHCSPRRTGYSRGV